MNDRMEAPPTTCAGKNGAAQYSFRFGVARSGVEPQKLRVVRRAQPHWDRTPTMVKLIAAANLIDDPDHIAVGQVVYFPSFELGG